MTAPAFEFSAPAQLYARHPTIPNLVEQMRQESYRSIAEFRKLLVGALTQEVEPARLCQKTTHAAGGWVGGELQYLWLGQNPDDDWNAQVGMAYFPCPQPDKGLDEKAWRDSLALIAESVLRLFVGYGGQDKEALRRTMSLAKRPEFHAEQTKGREFVVYLQLDGADPVGSARQQVAVLLRAIRDAQQGNG
jgi:hypothetical protein